jgi:predicted membrane protein
MTDFLFALNSCQTLVLKDGSCVPLAITMMVAALMLLMLVMMMVMMCSFAHILAVFGCLLLWRAKVRKKNRNRKYFQ